jgi:hypothetical protein
MDVMQDRFEPTLYIRIRDEYASCVSEQGRIFGSPGFDVDVEARLTTIAVNALRTGFGVWDFAVGVAIIDQMNARADCEIVVHRHVVSDAEFSGKAPNDRLESKKVVDVNVSNRDQEKNLDQPVEIVAGAQIEGEVGERGLVETDERNVRGRCWLE